MIIDLNISISKLINIISVDIFQDNKLKSINN